jgi:hypothetical protein
MPSRMLKLGNEDHFEDYQAEFDRLFPGGRATDVMGSVITFARDRCRHVCFKSEERIWNTGERGVWQQARAERIPWILEALTAPTCITNAPGNAWAYLLEVPRDQDNDVSGDLYVAIVRDRYFLTAFSISYTQWNKYRSNRPWVYPEGGEPPLKSKKLRAKKKRPRA